MPSRLGIDVGGTYTDFLLVDSVAGTSHAYKIPTSALDRAATVKQGVGAVVNAAGIQPGEIEAVIHGGSIPMDLKQGHADTKVGLLITKGFEQVLHLGAARTQDDGDTSAEFREAPAGLETTRGIVERISARGDTIIQLDEAAARQSVNELLQSGVQALAICLMHAYANPAHEMRVAAIIREIDDRVPIFLSHQIAPEADEYERALATVMNASLQPGMRRHLAALDEALKAAQISPEVGIAQSTGGIASPGQATEMPVQVLTSGRAGGAAGAARVASLAGYPDALAVDIGGTSSNISLIRGGLARMSNETMVGRDPIRVPALDVRCAGAGNGSIAHKPLPGILRVGPQGTGADPGPACNGRGGRLPTVADANVVLGRLSAGRLSLDSQAAEEVIAGFGRDSGLDLHRAAEAVIDIFNEGLAGSLRLIAVEKGHEPDQLALVASGGAGPLHGCALGMLIGCAPVIVPRNAGVLSAFGHLCAPASGQFVETLARTLGDIQPQHVADIIDVLEAKAQAWLRDAGTGGVVRYRADVRYFRRDFQVSLGVDPATLTGADGGLNALAGQLADAHQRRYGVRMEEPVELISLRAIATAEGTGIAPAKFDLGNPDPGRALTDHVQVYFDGAFTKTAVYDRDQLSAGNRFLGPAIVSQGDTTTVIHPGHVGEVDAFLNLLIRPDGVSTDGRS